MGWGIILSLVDAAHAERCLDVDVGIAQLGRAHGPVRSVVIQHVGPGHGMAGNASAVIGGAVPRGEGHWPVQCIHTDVRVGRTREAIAVAVRDLLGESLLRAVLVTHGRIVNQRLISTWGRQMVGWHRGTALASGAAKNSHILPPMAVGYGSRAHHSIAVRDTHLQVIAGGVNGVKFSGFSGGIGSAGFSIELVGGAVRTGNGIAESAVGCGSSAAGILVGRPRKAEAGSLLENDASIG